MKNLILISSCFLVLLSQASAQDIELELVMPTDIYGPGSPFSLALEIDNQGSLYTNAQLYLALTIGTGDFWFHPSWCLYPDEIDWEDIQIPADSTEIHNILPEFLWPSGTGEFTGAMFISVVLDQGALVSNIAECTFGWTETAIPTPTPTITPTITPTPTPSPIPPPEGYIYIPPGTFMMGSPDHELCRYPNEEIYHEVILTRPIFMLQTEVTQQQWVDLFLTNPSIFPDMSNPVENVNWFEACLYCNNLSLLDGFDPCYYSDESLTTVLEGKPPMTEGTIYWKTSANGYRLPTEAEWEYACRASSETGYNMAEVTECENDPNLAPLAWYKHNATGMPHAVSGKEPNLWNLHDMHGNVVEWVWDWYAIYPDETVTDPVGPATGGVKVGRGGSFLDKARWCRNAVRLYSSPATNNSEHGFRIVRNALD